MHDIVLVQLGLDVLEGDIAKSGQANLRERAIGGWVTSKRCETNLVC